MNWMHWLRDKVEKMDQKVESNNLLPRRNIWIFIVLREERLYADSTPHLQIFSFLSLNLILLHCVLIDFLYI